MYLSRVGPGGPELYLENFRIWQASTFWQLTFAFTSTTLSLGTFEGFITKFKEFFKHTNIKGNTIAWLSTTWMVKDKKNIFHPSLTDYISSFKNNIAEDNGYSL